MLIFLQRPYSVSYRDYRAIVRSSFVLLSWFCFLVKLFCICPVLRWFRSYSRLPCRSIATCVAAQLHPQLSIWSATALRLDICSHVSLVSPTSRQRLRSSASHRLAVPPARLSILSADEPSQFPAPTHNEQRHSIPGHFCIVTRGFQTASQNIPIFPFIPEHRHLTYTFLLHRWT